MNTSAVPLGSAVNSTAWGVNAGRKRRAAFTLVEIMVVVMIIGLIAAIAIPSMSRARDRVQRTRFINDLRVATAAFELYSLEHGRYPIDRGPGVVPPGMEEYLTNMNWTAATTIGGNWDWDYRVFGFTAGVSVYRPKRTDAQMAVIDAEIDDGNLATGFFRKRTNGFIYIIEF
jgi:prepilin-type N-terminal cleavage/methylation domain-containing protein